MLVANSMTGKVVARDVDREDGPFNCPECGEEVRVRKGSERVHHFSHLSGSTCTYGCGESEEHLNCKIQIFDYLSKNDNVTKLELERILPGVRPDVSFYYGDTPVAIEVQKSDISPELIKHRMKIYSKLGIFVMWIRPGFPTFKQHGISTYYRYQFNRYKAKNWELYLYRIHGNLFFWDNMFLAVKLEDSYGSSGGCFTSDGEEIAEYEYKHKSLKLPYIGEFDFDDNAFFDLNYGYKVVIELGNIQYTNYTKTYF